MSDYIISCCSTADLSKEYFQKKDIKVVYFHFKMDEYEYMDDLGESISYESFYEEMEKGVVTKTSQVNMEEYIEFFEPFLKDGKDIIHVCLSSGLSGTVNSAHLAQDELKERYPERKIYIVDSLGASSGVGLFADIISDMRNEGMGIEEVYEWAEKNKLNVNSWFFSGDLKYYVRGGRISKASGFVGNMLNICPILNVNSEGKLIVREKVRPKKKVIKRIVEIMKENVIDNDYSGKCFLSHSACYNDAKAVAELIEEQFPKLKGNIEIFNIGTTIGSHTGPGTVALFFMGRERTL